MSGTRISDMTPLPSLPASGATVPVVKTGETTNYGYDLAADLAARPTSALLAASTGVSLVGGSARPVATRAALADLDHAVFTTALLRESGRAGTFVFSSADLSAKVTLDPQQGIYVAPLLDASGASGAWVRQYSPIAAMVNWFGTVGDNSTDDSAAIQAAINLFKVIGGTLIFEPNTNYLLTTGLTISLSVDGSVPLRLQGSGCSFLRTTANIDVLTISNTAGTTANTRRVICDSMGFIHSGATSRGLVLDKAAYNQFINCEFLGIGQAIVVGTTSDTVGIGNQFTNIRLTSVGTGVYIGSQYTIFTNLQILEGLQGGPYALQIDGANCVVDDFTARGAGGSGGTATVVVTGFATGLSLGNGKVFESYAIGVAVGAARNVMVSNVYITSSQTHGLQLSGTTQSKFDVTINASSLATADTYDQVHLINTPADNRIDAQFSGTQSLLDINEASGTNNTFICGSLPNGRTNSGAGSVVIANGSLQPNVQTVTSSATVTPAFTNDQVNITAQAAGLTLANPSGTGIAGKHLVIRIKDNGTARAISFGTQYRAIGVTLPTTTVISKVLYLRCVWNATETKMDVLQVAQEA